MWPFLKQTIQPNREESYKVSLASGLHTLLLLPIFNQRHYRIVYFAQIYTRVLWVHSDSSISGLILDIFSSLEPSLSRKIQLPCVSSTTSGFSSLIAMCANQNCHCLVRCSSLRWTASLWHVFLLCFQYAAPGWCRWIFHCFPCWLSSELQDGLEWFSNSS